MKSIKGFTLLEILVSLAIVALALTLIGPRLTNAIAGTQIKSAARHLTAGLREARSEAITRQHETVFTVDVVNKGYSLGKEHHRLDVPETTELSLVTADSEQLNAKQGAIRFFPDGSSTGGRIDLKDDRQHFMIDVNWLTGKIRISP